MSALKWAGTEISLRKPYFIIMAPAFITVYIKYKTHRMFKQYYSYGKKKNGHAWADRIFVVNTLAIPTVWALAGQMAEGVYGS